MLTLRIQFDQCKDPQEALARIRFRGNTQGLSLHGDLLHIPTDDDHSFRFGRHWSCDVILYATDFITPCVARKHLQIEVTSQICYVRDLATKNGTKLNQRWLGGPPAPHLSSASRTPSGRQKLQAGDVIWLPGITLTVIDLPTVRTSPSSTGQPARDQFATQPDVLRLPPAVALKSAESPSSPPVLEGFKFTTTLGGKPASGLSYLYERANVNGVVEEKWVVKYFGLRSSCDLDSLRHQISRLFSVQNAALHHPQAYSLVQDAREAHVALCFPHFKGINLTRSTLLDLAAIHDVMSSTLGALAALHQQGLVHGHVCADNIFLDGAGQIALTDSGLNGIRSLIGAELTGPAPSASNDLIALGDLCLNLLGETANAPQRPLVGRIRDQQQGWPGLPLRELACHLRQDPQLTARQAMELLRKVPRPKVNRLLTVPQWRPSRKGSWPATIKTF